MAVIVPKYNPTQQTQAGPSGGFSGASSADVFGAGVGRGMGALGGELAQVGLEMQEKEDIARTSEAYTALSDAWRTSNAELRQRQGLDAKNITTDGDKTLHDLYEQHSKDLTKGQADRLRAMYLQLRTGALNGLSAYEAGEMDSAHKAQLTAIADTAVAEAFDNPRPEVIGRSLKNIDTAVRQAMRGQSPEVQDAAVLAKQSELHAGIIGMIQSKDPHRAKVYLEENKAQIDGRTEAKIRMSLETATQAHDAAAIAGEVWATAADQADVPAMREAVYKKTKDPELRKMAMAEINQRDAEADEYKKQHADETFNEIYDEIEGGMTLASAMQDPRWADLSPSHQEALKSTSAGAKHDPQVYLDLLDAADADPQEFANTSLKQYAYALSSGELTALSKMQRSIRAGQSTRTYNEMLKDSAVAIGIDPAPGSKKKATRYIEFRSAFDAEVNQFFDQHNREPNTAEAQEIINNISKVVAKKGRNVASYRYNPEGVPRQYVDDITRTLRSKNVRITDSAMFKQYLTDFAFPDVPASQIESIIAYLSENEIPVTLENVRDARAQYMRELEASGGLSGGQ